MTTNVDSFKQTLILDWKISDTDDFADSAIQFADTLQKITSFTDGTGDTQVKMLWRDRRTLGATSNDDLDLAGGLTNAFGTAIIFTKLKGLILINRSTTAGEELEIGGPASNPISTLFGDTSDKILVGPSGWCVLMNPIDGHTITAGSADTLRIRNPNATSVTYDLFLYGTV